MAAGRTMLLKPRVMDHRAKDEISEALAVTVALPERPGATYRDVPSYIYHYAPTDLRDRCLGPHAKQLVRVSRFYPKLTPPVVVDFEPPPPEKWFVDEKRAYFGERGIAYVPIALRDKYDEDGFKAYVESCREVAVLAAREHRQQRALKAAQKDVEEWLQDPELMKLVDDEAVEVLRKELAERPRGINGNAKHKFLTRVKKEILLKIRKDLKHGRLVDPLDRYRQPAHAAE